MSSADPYNDPDLIKGDPEAYWKRMMAWVRSMPVPDETLEHSKPELPSSKEQAFNWVTPDMTAAEAVGVAKKVDSEEWTRLNDHFFHSCCDCGLSHRVDVRSTGDGFEVRFYRLEEYTEHMRKRLAVETAEYRQIGVKRRSHDGRSEYVWWEIPAEDTPILMDQNAFYVRTAVKASVHHAVTCKKFPDPHDEREPAGLCTCGSEKTDAPLTQQEIEECRLYRSLRTPTKVPDETLTADKPADPRDDELICKSCGAKSDEDCPLPYCESGEYP